MKNLSVLIPLPHSKWEALSIFFNHPPVSLTEHLQNWKCFLKTCLSNAFSPKLCHLFLLFGLSLPSIVSSQCFPLRNDWWWISGGQVLHSFAFFRELEVKSVTTQNTSRLWMAGVPNTVVNLFSWVSVCLGNLWDNNILQIMLGGVLYLVLLS